MRVLFLSHRFADVSVGGLAEFLHFLPAALKKYDIESIIYTQTPKGGAKQLNEPVLLKNGVPHYAGPFLKPRWWVSQKEIQPLLDLCQKEKIDLIHAQGTYRAGFMARQVHQRSGIPYVITSHSDISAVNSERIQRFSAHRRCKKILKHAAAVTHLTPLMATISHQIYDTREKSTLIHNGIDMTIWQPGQTHLTEQDYMLAIGRLEPEKGFSVLIDAYAALIKTGVKTALIIAGTGSIEAELHAQAKAHNIPVLTHYSITDALPEKSIIFTGYCRADDKINLFKQAKLVLFATQPKLFEEAFGIVQIEAMAAGKPLIASDIATTHYLQSLGLQALTVTPDQPEEWKKAMLALLNDDNKRFAMGQDNAQAARLFDWRLVAKQYADVFDAVFA